MEKRILILTAGFGEGHNAAARGIRDGLAAVSGGKATVELHDIFAESYGFVNDWARHSYLTLINRAPGAWGRFYRWLDGREEFAPQIRRLPMAKGRLRRLLARFQPTVVVSVFPAYPYLLETSVPGIFAVGDVRHGSIKRVASGVGEGSMAIAFVHQYLAELNAPRTLAPVN
jgi:processive 1,2-diacylglycerol beta-glucosyltransferase